MDKFLHDKHIHGMMCAFMCEWGTRLIKVISSRGQLFQLLFSFHFSRRSFLLYLFLCFFRIHKMHVLSQLQIFNTTKIELSARTDRNVRNVNITKRLNKMSYRMKNQTLIALNWLSFWRNLICESKAPLSTVLI